MSDLTSNIVWNYAPQEPIQPSSCRNMSVMEGNSEQLGPVKVRWVQDYDVDANRPAVYGPVRLASDAQFTVRKGRSLTVVDNRNITGPFEELVVSDSDSSGDEVEFLPISEQAALNSFKGLNRKQPAIEASFDGQRYVLEFDKLEEGDTLTVTTHDGQTYNKVFAKIPPSWKRITYF